MLVGIGWALFYWIRKARAGTGTEEEREPTVAWSSVGPRVRIDMGPMFFSMNAVDDEDDDDDDDNGDKEDENEWLVREMEVEGAECIQLTTFGPSAKPNEHKTGEEETGL